MMDSITKSGVIFQLEVLAAILQTMVYRDVTQEELAVKMNVPTSYVMTLLDNLLFQPTNQEEHPTLREVSDLLHALDCKMQIKLIPIEQDTKCTVTNTSHQNNTSKSAQLLIDSGELTVTATSSTVTP